MKKYAVSLIALATLVGCSGSSSDVEASTSKPGEGQAQNPSGKPQTPEAQALSDQMTAAGQAQAAGQGAAAQAAANAMKAGK